jgi:hypothetical protein
MVSVLFQSKLGKTGKKTPSIASRNVRLAKQGRSSAIVPGDPSNLSQGSDQRSITGRQQSEDKLPSIAIERDG